MARKLDEKVLSGFSRELRAYLSNIRESIDRFNTHHDTFEQISQDLNMIKGALEMIGFSTLSQVTTSLRGALEASQMGDSALDAALRTWLGHTVGQLDRNLDLILSGQVPQETFVTEVEQSLSRYTHSEKIPEEHAETLVEAEPKGATPVQDVVMEPALLNDTRSPSVSPPDGEILYIALDTDESLDIDEQSADTDEQFASPPSLHAVEATTNVDDRPLPYTPPGVANAAEAKLLDPCETGKPRETITFSLFEDAVEGEEQDSSVPLTPFDSLETYIIDGPPDTPGLGGGEENDMEDGQRNAESDVQESSDNFDLNAKVITVDTSHGVEQQAAWGDVVAPAPDDVSCADEIEPIQNPSEALKTTTSGKADADTLGIVKAEEPTLVDLASGFIPLGMVEGDETLINKPASLDGPRDVSETDVSPTQMLTEPNVSTSNVPIQPENETTDLPQKLGKPDESDPLGTAALSELESEGETALSEVLPLDTVEFILQEEPSELPDLTSENKDDAHQDTWEHAVETLDKSTCEAVPFLPIAHEAPLEVSEEIVGTETPANAQDDSTLTPSTMAGTLGAESDVYIPIDPIAAESDQYAPFWEFDEESSEDTAAALHVAPAEAENLDTLMAPLVSDDDDTEQQDDTLYSESMEAEEIPQTPMTLTTRESPEPIELLSEALAWDAGIELLMSETDDVGEEESGTAAEQETAVVTPTSLLGESAIHTIPTTSELAQPVSHETNSLSIAGQKDSDDISTLSQEEALPELLFDPAEDCDEEPSCKETVRVAPESPSVESTAIDDIALATTTPIPTREASEPSAPQGQELSSLIEVIDAEIQETYGQRELSASERFARDELRLAERYLMFTLAGSRYAVAVSHVLEIGRLPALSFVPNVPAWVSGVINLRGEIISVIDLRTFLGFESNQQPDQSRLLVVKTDDDTLTTSLIVDHVNGFARLAQSAIQPMSTSFHSQLDPYMRGISEYEGQVLAVFDLEEFLQSSEIAQFGYR